MQLKFRMLLKFAHEFVGIPYPAATAPPVPNQDLAGCRWGKPQFSDSTRARTCHGSIIPYLARLGSPILRTDFIPMAREYRSDTRWGFFKVVSKVRRFSRWHRCNHCPH